VPQQTQRYNTSDESAFLAQQATDAKTAMQRTLAEMKTSATEVTNIRWWTQQYPWYAVGAAAVLGFVAVRKALAPSPPSPPVVAAAPATNASWLAPLFEMVRTTLMSAIIGAVHTSGEKTGQTQQAEADDLHRAPPPPGPGVYQR
jgi:hypothetical protein